MNRTAGVRPVTKAEAVSEMARPQRKGMRGKNGKAEWEGRMEERRWRRRVKEGKVEGRRTTEKEGKTSGCMYHILYDLTNAHSVFYT